MSVYDVFAAEIQHFEGWAPGTRSYRNNNPGNLKPNAVIYSGQVGLDSGGFAVFGSYTDGYNALINDIYAKFTGNTRTGLGPNSTVLQFFQIYAPSSDNNNPQIYAQTVINGVNAQLGTSFTVGSTLGQLAAADAGNSVPVVASDGSGSDTSVDNSSIDNTDNQDSGSGSTPLLTILAFVLLLSSQH